MTNLYKKITFLETKHQTLKERIIKETGEHIKHLKKEKLFIKDKLEKTRLQANSVL
jgi:hypothetical protein